MKLSLSMIVKNEENHLTTALESVSGIHEIVICDTGSTDNTVELAKNYTDKVFTDYTWNDDFAEARNHALAKCTGDWILIVDADERLATPIEEVIKYVTEADQKGLKTISCKVISEKWNQMHRQPRLFKRCDEVFWKGAIHNHLSVDEHNYQDIEVYYGYSDAHQKDPDRALRILTKVVNEKPDRAREKYYLAREYWYRHDYTTALHWYEKYIQVSKYPEELADAYLMSARCLHALGNMEQAKTQCLNAIKVNTNFKEAILFLASLSGPKNKKRWTEFAEGATNEDVLFIR